MAKVKFKVKGDLRKTRSFLKKAANQNYFSNLDEFAKEGVDALSSATPYDTGLTAQCWGYYISSENGRTSIVWTNSNVNDGVNIAIILQYGHGTGTGGYVQGRDYINPAIAPIFDRIAEDVWREVKSYG